MIRIGKLKKTIGTFVLDIDLVDFLPGRATCLYGNSGSGKSVFLQILAGLNSVPPGTLLWDSEPFAERHKARTGSYLGEGMLADSLTPGEYLSLKAFLFGLDPKKIIPPYLAHLAEVGERIFESSNFLVDLSTDQRKRVGVYTALSCMPEFILLDEPFESLDTEAARILDAELGLRASQGAIVVFSSPGARLLEHCATTMVELSDGRLVLADGHHSPM